MMKAGVGNHCRAVYLFKIGRELLVSRKQKFHQFHAHILHRNTIAWNRAYAIVFQYFCEHGLVNTNDIAALENHNAIAVNERAMGTADEQLENLVDGAAPKRLLKQRLEVVKETPKASEKSRRSYLKVWQRRTPTARSDQKGVTLIASPAVMKKEGGDSEELSDFVIEEITPRRSKR
jgi:hypothetical protein